MKEREKKGGEEERRVCKVNIVISIFYLQPSQPK